MLIAGLCSIGFGLMLRVTLPVRADAEDFGALFGFVGLPLMIISFVLNWRSQ